MNLGVAITSVTMTGFYLILAMVWQQLYPEAEAPQAFLITIWATAALRIILCMFPQNKWFSGGNARWSFYRNFTFAICGVCVAMLFLISGNMDGYGLYKMAIAIFISFGCYLPVTIWSKRIPAIGALMMPKTCAYIWMISMEQVSADSYEQDKLQEELKAAEKAEKEAAEKAKMEEIIKAVKKSGKFPEEILTFLSNE